MPAGRVIALEGASGAGKTTALDALARGEGWTTVPEAYRRLDPPPPLEVGGASDLLQLEERLLAEEARRYVECRAAARSGVTVLADTGFFGPLSYTAGLIALGAAPPELLSTLVATARAHAAAGRWGGPDGILWLATPEAARSERVRADPVGHPPDLARRHALVGAVERALYARRIGPLFGPRYREVSGAGDPAAVARRLDVAVRTIAAVRTRLPPLATVLAAFERDPPVSRSR